MNVRYSHLPVGKAFTYNSYKFVKLNHISAAGEGGKISFFPDTIVKIDAIGSEAAHLQELNHFLKIRSALISANNSLIDVAKIINKCGEVPNNRELVQTLFKELSALINISNAHINLLNKNLK